MDVNTISEQQTLDIIDLYFLVYFIFSYSIRCRLCANNLKVMAFIKGYRGCSRHFKIELLFLHLVILITVNAISYVNPTPAPTSAPTVAYQGLINTIILYVSFFVFVFQRYEFLTLNILYITIKRKYIYNHTYIFIFLRSNWLLSFVRY